MLFRSEEGVCDHALVREDADATSIALIVDRETQPDRVFSAPLEALVAWAASMAPNAEAPRAFVRIVEASAGGVDAEASARLAQYTEAGPVKVSATAIGVAARQFWSNAPEEQRSQDARLFESVMGADLERVAPAAPQASTSDVPSPAPITRATEGAKKPAGRIFSLIAALAIVKIGRAHV